MAIGRIPEPGTGIPESIIAAKGDILTGTANDTPAVLTVGTDGYTLVADSVETTGLKWVAPAGGGKVLQVVSATYGTETTSTSTSWADTGLTASITPSAATSKILVLTFGSYALTKDTDDKVSGGLRLVRGATAIFGSESASGPADLHVMDQNSGGNRMQLRAWQTFNYLDSPNTTSSTAYKIQFAVTSGSTMLAQYNSNDATIILLEIGA